MFFYVLLVFSIWGNLDIPIWIFLILCSFCVTWSYSCLLIYHCLQKPRAWNLQALQVWFQSVIATKDFIYFIYCLTFVTSHLYLRCQYHLAFITISYLLNCWVLFTFIFLPCMLMQKFVAVALIPILCLALEHAAKFLRRNFSLSSLYR